MKENKLIIGIIPTITNSKDDPYQDNYHVVTMYMDMIEKNNAIAFMIPIINNHVDYDSLKICDAFLLPGSEIINNLYYEVIDYAINNHKSLLGICAGMQALSIYSRIINKTKKYNDLFWQEYNNLKNKGILLNKVNNHYHKITKDTLLDSVRHNININKDSFLYKVYGNNKDVISMHSYSIRDVDNDFKIVAYSDDNIIEAIEYNKDNLIIGIQFHIEIDESDNLFKEFISYINDKKTR